MQRALLAELRGQRPHIYARWVDLLPPELPAGGRTVDGTLDDVFFALDEPATAPPEASSAAVMLEEVCRSGRNLLLDFFAAGEQALHEGLKAARSAESLPPAEHDEAVDRLNMALGRVALRKHETICRECPLRAALACEQCPPAADRC